jgi:hypothetical protein
MPEGLIGKYGPYKPILGEEYMPDLVLAMLGMLAGPEAEIAMFGRAGSVIKIGTRVAPRAGAEAEAEVAAKAVPGPRPVLKSSGAPDRSSAVYISVRRADGTIETVGSRPGGVHAEDAAQAIEPGGQMSRPFGWRRDAGTGQLTWQPINVCVVCQPKYPPSMFPAGTAGDRGGVWDELLRSGN